MGILSRLKLIFQTETNGVLDNLEDPKKSLDYSLVRLEENLRQARQSLVDIVTAQRMLRARGDEAAAAATHYEEQARKALENGREDLARLAVERKQTVLARRQELEAAAANLDGQAESLKATLFGLHTRIELFKSKKEELKAIYDSSRAQLKVREALTGLSSDLDDVGRTIQRAEERIRRMQARAAAIDQLAGTGAVVDSLAYAGDDVDRELTMLSRSAAAEADLARLKQEVAGRYIEGKLEPEHGSRALSVDSSGEAPVETGG